jgi:hypothetical protein
MAPQQSLPRELLSIRDTVSKISGVVNAKLHTTPAGEWGLTVHLEPGVNSVAAQVEKLSGSFPVQYETGDYVPVARPAFPEREE